MYYAESWPGHIVLISKVDFHITSSRKPQGTKALKPVNISKLKNVLVTTEPHIDLEAE